jgi:hypothetical protein
MKKVERSELLDHETYGERRGGIRARILEIKEDRRIHVGDHLTFLFENADTIRYQIQEMMRAERIVKEEAILHEMRTYNEILGDDGELGCCLLIEIDDPAARKDLLKEWVDLPRHVYLRTADGRTVHAAYDARQIGDDRLSSVQYLKFAVGDGTPAAVGCDLSGMEVESALTERQQRALSEDLQS